MEVSKEIFDEFIQWLKLDGLTPKKSERLWKKTILARLINGHKNTKENWEDFLVYFNQKQVSQTPVKDFDENCLVGIGVSIMGIHRTIRNIVKCETMSRIFFIDGTDIDVDNSVVVQLIKVSQGSICD